MVNVRQFVIRISRERKSSRVTRISTIFTGIDTTMMRNTYVMITILGRRSTWMKHVSSLPVLGLNTASVGFKVATGWMQWPKATYYKKVLLREKRLIHRQWENNPAKLEHRPYCCLYFVQSTVTCSCRAVLPGSTRYKNISSRILYIFVQALTLEKVAISVGLDY